MDIQVCEEGGHLPPPFLLLCHYSHQGHWAPQLSITCQRLTFSLPAEYQKAVSGFQSTTPTIKERRPSVQTPGTLTGGPNSPARTSFPEAGKGLSAEVPQLYWSVQRAPWRQSRLSKIRPRPEACAQRCPTFPGHECDCRKQKLSEAEKIVCLFQWNYLLFPSIHNFHKHTHLFVQNIRCSLLPTILETSSIWGDFLGGTVVKNLPANAGGAGNVDSILGSGRSPGVGNGSLLQYSCLENLMDKGAWWATVNGVAKESDMTEHTAFLESSLPL